VGRFIGLNLKFDCFNSHGQQVKGKTMSIFLASVYYLCHCWLSARVRDPNARVREKCWET
jgi:hypothetical protein